MMGELGQFGRLLVGIGGVLVLVGILIPLATSILLSIILTLLLNLWTRR